MLSKTGKLGYTSEGYRPFIEMNLKKDNTYKVVILLEDKPTYNIVHIKTV